MKSGEPANGEAGEIILRGAGLMTGYWGQPEKTAERLNGDFVNNPYLKNDDVLVFPTYDIGHNFFSVYGAVNKPGTFFYVEGDKISDALELVDGINPAYENVDSIEISRLSYDGQTQTKVVFPIDEDFQIQRGDRFRFLAS